MFLPTTQDLKCHAIKGCEGIGTIYTANITYAQFCDFFDIADTDVDEFEKFQRDPTAARSKGVTKYVIEREKTLFPSVTGVATRLDFEPLNIESLNGVSEIGVLTLRAVDERALVDGQGRRLGIAAAISLAAKLRKRTIDIKFIPTNTKTLSQAKQFIQQIFSDYHKKVVKPNSSINLFFDSSAASSTFAVEAHAYLKSNDLMFNNFISLDGNNKRIWTLAQFKKFLTRFTGLTDSEMDQELTDPEASAFWLESLGEFFKRLGALKDFSLLNTTEEMAIAKKTSLLCCAIGIEGVGYLSNMIMDIAISREADVDWSSLDALCDIDFSKDSQFWLGEVVDKHGKMIKGSAKQMAILIASELRLPIPMKFLKTAA